MRAPGTQLKHLCAGARHVLIIAAPFIKASALKQLLHALPENVAVTCITRWRVDEIAAGVSDLEVWPLLRDRAHATLHLRANLHAKYYRADSDVLVGSANITNAALGWSRTPNLELLVPMQLNDHLLAFEEQLTDDVITVDDALHDAVALATERFKSTMLPLTSVEEPVIALQDEAESSSVKQESVYWLPQTRYPEHLYTVYSGELEQVTTATAKTSLEDLAFLQIPPGMSREAFEACVAGILLLLPITQELDQFVQSPRRFGEMRQWLAQHPRTKEMNRDEVTYAWQVLMRWLLYFLPSMYRLDVPSHSEVFGKVHDHPQ